MEDTNLIIKAKDSIIKALDQNGNGEIDIEDIITLAFKTPGVHVTRANFLQKELYKNHPQAVIDKAIATTPAQAGISSDEIDNIADEVILLKSGQIVDRGSSKDILEKEMVNKKCCKANKCK